MNIIFFVMFNWWLGALLLGDVHVCHGKPSCTVWTIDPMETNRKLLSLCPETLVLPCSINSTSHPRSLEGCGYISGPSNPIDLKTCNIDDVSTNIKTFLLLE